MNLAGIRLLRKNLKMSGKVNLFHGFIVLSLTMSAFPNEFHRHYRYCLGNTIYVNLSEYCDYERGSSVGIMCILGFRVNNILTVRYA